MHSLYILQLDPPTDTAIGPSPARKRAATSRNPITLVLHHLDSHHVGPLFRHGDERELLLTVHNVQLDLDDTNSVMTNETVFCHSW